ncbi:hypothetical protein HPP92_009732 [Vanilla planifolia]|uniref:Uncharacterized protein n=1 Tax=Vanilla planifolia TaxID=51239 RepID=A0A835RKD8_VANPL|nr:hypothetical protein HPP92_009965 [Vanilla planifolia]KAG0487637.1 hypothetical protein HPP92_009732 [Vanilla planifolia]
MEPTQTGQEGERLPAPRRRMRRPQQSGGGETTFCRKFQGKVGIDAERRQQRRAAVGAEAPQVGRSKRRAACRSRHARRKAGHRRPARVEPVRAHVADAWIRGGRSPSGYRQNRHCADGGCGHVLVEGDGELGWVYRIEWVRN